jgi:hypothetical protein
MVVPRDGWGVALAIGAALLAGLATWMVMNRVARDGLVDARRGAQ